MIISVTDPPDAQLVDRSLSALVEETFLGNLPVLVFFPGDGHGAACAGHLVSAYVVPGDEHKVVPVFSLFPSVACPAVRQVLVRVLILDLRDPALIVPLKPAPEPSVRPGCGLAVRMVVADTHDP